MIAALALALALAGAPDAGPLARADDPRAIRSVPLEALFATALGTVSRSEVIYADLTGDGREEAVVPLFSGGTAGDIAVAVYGFDAHGALQLLAYRTGQQLQAKVSGRALLLTEPVFRAGDPECCPSGHRTVRLVWDRKRFVAR